MVSGPVSVSIPFDHAEPSPVLIVSDVFPQKFARLPKDAGMSSKLFRTTNTEERWNEILFGRNYDLIACVGVRNADKFMESLFSHLLERQTKRERKGKKKAQNILTEKIPLWANSKHFVGVEC